MQSHSPRVEAIEVRRAGLVKRMLAGIIGFSAGPATTLLTGYWFGFWFLAMLGILVGFPLAALYVFYGVIPVTQSQGGRPIVRYGMIGSVIVVPIEDD